MIATSFCIYYLKSAKIVVSPRNVLSYIHEVFTTWLPKLNLIKDKTNGHTNVEEKHSRTRDRELQAIKKCSDKEKKKPSTGKSTPSGNLVTNGQL